MALTRETNFASQRARPVRGVATLVWLAGFGLVAALVWAWIETMTLRSQIGRFEAHTERLEAQIAAITPRLADAPSAEQLAAQSEEIAFFNTLTGPRTAPLGQVLGTLAAELPGEVWVSQLTYSAENGRLSVALQAGEEAVMPGALRALEQADLFSAVILERQIRLQQGGRNLMQYDVEAVAE